MNQYVFWVVFFGGGIVSLAASVGMGLGLTYVVCAVGWWLSAVRLCFCERREREHRNVFRPPRPWPPAPPKQQRLKSAGS